MKRLSLYLLIITTTLFLFSCTKKEGCTDPAALNFDVDAEKDNGSCVYSPILPPETEPIIPSGPAPLQIPQLFSQYINPPVIPTNNPQTYEGIALGRKLFFDPILSGDGTQACASCHMPENAFVDTNQFSTGITMALGNRNSMPIFNLAFNYNEKFFWDGRAISLEDQALGPVVNPIEMNNTWPNAVASLQADPNYPALFDTVFGTPIIDSLLVAKALAQFERTLISGNAKFDQYLKGQTALTSQELNGFSLFMDEQGGDCFHCHGSASNPLWTDNEFHNNGLDAVFTDNGLGDISGNPADNGKFRTPSLRNLAYTYPYMHDGRFTTLEQVIDHYSSGLVNSPTIDASLKYIGQGGVQLTPPEKADLKAFLLTLSEPGFVTNPDFKDPNL